MIQCHRTFCVLLGIIACLIGLPRAIFATELSISSVDPLVVGADSEAQTITVTGSGFLQDLYVQVDSDAANFSIIDDNTLTVSYTFSGTAIHTLSVTAVNTTEVATWPEGIISTLPGEIITSARKITNAGGARVNVYGFDAFTDETLVGLNIDISGCPEDTAMLPVAALVRERIFISQSKLQITTPAMPQGEANLVAYEPGDSKECRFTQMEFTPMVLTVNDVGQSISIIDAVDEGVFGDQPELPFPYAISPAGIAFSRGSTAGSETYIVDRATGKLEFFNTSSLQYDSNIDLSQQPVLAATEVAVSEDGVHAYVLHPATELDNCSGINCQAAGGVSVVNIQSREMEDVDGNKNTTSYGAAPGITRIDLTPGFAPLSEEVVYLAKSIANLQVGNGYPGEYLFIGGVTLPEGLLEDPPEGTHPCTLTDNCESGQIGPGVILIVDLNPWIVSSKNGPDPVFSANPAFRTIVKTLEIGIDVPEGQFDGGQGIEFASVEDPENGKRHVYAVSRASSMMAEIDVETLEPLGSHGVPTLWAAGNGPSDIQTMQVSLPDPTGVKLAAYITNTVDDTITILDTSTNGEFPAPLSPISMDSCVARDYFPSSIIAASDGSNAFISNYHSNSLSVLNLTRSAVSESVCNIPVGAGPIKAAMQLSMTGTDVLRILSSTVAFADDSLFGSASDKLTLLRDIEQLTGMQALNEQPESLRGQLETVGLHSDQYVSDEPLKSALSEMIQVYAFTIDKTIFLQVQSTAPFPRNSGGAWIFYGGNDDPSTDLQGLKARMRQLKKPNGANGPNGAQYIRLWIPWSAFEPSQGNYQKEKFDKLISAIVSTGNKLHITISTNMTPNWIWNSELKNFQPRFFDPTAGEIKDMVDLGGGFVHDPFSVTSPPLTYWAPASEKNKLKTFIDKAFNQVLDNWSHYIIYLGVTHGRFNEPNYPDADHFWAYDAYAEAEWQAGHNGQKVPVETLGSAPENTLRIQDFTTPSQRSDFFTWYREKKRTFITEFQDYLKGKKQGWQKLAIIPAGGDADIGYRDDWFPQRVPALGCGQNSSQTIFDAAVNKTWVPREDSPCENAIRHMQDSFSMIYTAKSKGWVSTFAGINGTAGCNVSTGNPTCFSLTAYAARNEVQYTGPFYGQIASLLDDQYPTQVQCNQPQNMGQAVVDRGYSGIHWNKDDNLFLSNNQPSCRFDPLSTGWTSVRNAHSGNDYEDPVISNIVINAESGSVSWATKDSNGQPEDADTQLLYGPDNPAQGNNYLKFSVGGLPTTRRPDHSVTFNVSKCPNGCYYAITSTDASGNTGVAEGFLETTPSVPPKPVLSAPAVGKWTPWRPTFFWNAVDANPPVQSYKLFVKKLPNGPTTTYANLTTTSKRIPAGSELQDKTDYEWWVKAHNSLGDSEESTHRTFTVRMIVSVDVGGAADHPIETGDIGLNRIISPTEINDGQTTSQNVCDESYRKNRADNSTPASPYMYFDVDNRFISNDNPYDHVTVKIKYRNIGSGAGTKFCFEYLDSANHLIGRDQPHQYCQTVPVGPECFKEVTFNVSDTDNLFADRHKNGIAQNRPFDFRIWSGAADSQRWIDQITIEKVN